jgi:DinB superfamily
MPHMGEHHHHHNPAKHEVHLALVRRLRAQAADIQRLTSGLDEAVLASHPIPGKWSIKELICHFRRMEEIFADRFERTLTEETTIVPYANPDGDDVFVALTTRPAVDVLAEFLSDREALCRRLESLSPAEWHRKAKHPEFSHYDVHFQAEYMAHHEAHHIYQLFQRRVTFGKLPH